MGLAVFDGFFKPDGKGIGGVLGVAAGALEVVVVEAGEDVGAAFACGADGGEGRGDGAFGAEAGIEAELVVGGDFGVVFGGDQTEAGGVHQFAVAEVVDDLAGGPFAGDGRGVEGGVLSTGQEGFEVVGEGGVAG